MYAFVAIASLLSVETFSVRHLASMLGKDPMNVAALFVKGAPSAGKQRA